MAPPAECPESRRLRLAYAAYGGVYISVALLWLWAVENQRPSRWDIIGAAVSLLGMSMIVVAGQKE